MKLKKNIPWKEKDLSLNVYKFRYELSLATLLTIIRYRKISCNDDDNDSAIQAYDFFKYYKGKENEELNEQTITLRNYLEKLYNSNIKDKSILDTLREYVNKEALITLQVSKRIKVLTILTCFFSLLTFLYLITLLINNGKAVIVLHTNSNFLPNILNFLFHYGLYISLFLTIISILILIKNRIEISLIRRPSSLYFIKWIDSKYDIDQSILELKEIINKQITQVQTKSENPTKPKEVFENEIPYDENDNPLINWIKQKSKQDYPLSILTKYNSDVYKRCVLCEFIETAKNMKLLDCQFGYFWGKLIPEDSEDKGNREFYELIINMNINAKSFKPHTLNTAIGDIRKPHTDKHLDERLAKILKKYEYLIK